MRKKQMNKTLSDLYNVVEKLSEKIDELIEARAKPKLMLGDIQKIIIDKSKESGGVSYPFIMELYGEKSHHHPASDATITKLKNNNIIENIPQAYPIRYRFKNTMVNKNE